MIFNIIKYKKELLDNNNCLKKKLTRKFRNNIFKRTWCLIYRLCVKRDKRGVTEIIAKSQQLSPKVLQPNLTEK